MAEVQERLIDPELAALVECSTHAIVSLTIDGTSTSWNPAAERLYQYQAAEVLGQHGSLVVPLELLPEAVGSAGWSIGKVDREAPKPHRGSSFGHDVLRR